MHFHPSRAAYIPTCTRTGLNTFMSIHHLPHEMRSRLREYIQQSRHIHRGQQRKHLMRLMSPQLQGEVALVMNHKWLKNVAFLKNVERELIILIATNMQPAVSSPEAHTALAFCIHTLACM